MRPITECLRTSAVVSACLASLRACGGGGTSAASPAPATNTSSHATAPVHLSFVVPKKTASSKARSAQYVSTPTQSLTITVTPAGGTAQSPISVACTATCVANFQAPVGTDSIALALTDGPNGTGNQLSLSTTTVSVVLDTANTFNLIANSVVDHVVLTLGSASVTGGTPSSIPVTLAAIDADGNTIVGPGNFVDAAGNALTLTLGATNNQAGGNGMVTISSNSFSVPPSAAITATYNGAWLASTSIALTAPAAIAARSSAVAITSVPTAYEFGGPSSSPYGISTGPDGALWFTEPLVNQLGRVTTAGTVSEISSGMPSGATPYGITLGPDNALWIADRNNSAYERYVPGGTAVEYGSGFSAKEIGVGPDGALWGSEEGGDSVDRVTVAGAFTYVETFHGRGAGVTTGSDGRIWTPWHDSDVLTAVNVNGTYTDYPVPAGTGPRYIATGADGNVWFPEFTTNCIGRMTVTGAYQHFCSNISANPGFGEIVEGPDGNLWFAEGNNGIIGRIDAAGNITEYSAGITPGSNVFGLTVGPDHNIWFTEYNDNRVGKLVL